MSLRLSLLLAAALAAGTGSGALAQAPAVPRPTEAPRPAPETAPARPSSSTTLDDLFKRLAASKDEEEATGIAGLIERRLTRSGSDTADLLMQRSGEALKADDAALAVELLDRITQLKPDWAEAWNRRAAAFHSLDDPGQAMLDLHEALMREPRHFPAWTALGHLELAQGHKARALAAYREALKIHPHLSSVTTIVEHLAPEVDGRDL